MRLIALKPLNTEAYSKEEGRERQKKTCGWLPHYVIFLYFCYIKLLMALDVYFYIGLIFCFFHFASREESEKGKKYKLK